MPAVYWHVSSTEEQITALALILQKGFKCPGNGTLNTKRKKDSHFREKTRLQKRSFLTDLEKSMPAKFMAKVQIKGSAKKGLIEIRYTSMDELNRLAGLILDDLK